MVTKTFVERDQVGRDWNTSYQAKVLDFINVIGLSLE